MQFYCQSPGHSIFHGPSKEVTTDTKLLPYRLLYTPFKVSSPPYGGDNEKRIEFSQKRFPTINYAFITFKLCMQINQPSAGYSRLYSGVGSSVHIILRPSGLRAHGCTVIESELTAVQLINNCIWT